MEAKVKVEATKPEKEAASSSNDRKVKLDSGMVYGASQWSDEEEEVELVDSKEPEPEEAKLRDGYESEAKKAFRTWSKLRIDWLAEFPEELKGKDPAALDAVADLLPLDVGKIYRKITETDTYRRLYGYIPLMASSSFGQIGTLNAESFCERVLRCAGHVLTEGNTLLSDEELEMLVILRMNRKFMEYTRKHHNNLTADHFGPW